MDSLAFVVVGSIVVVDRSLVDLVVAGFVAGSRAGVVGRGRRRGRGVGRDLHLGGLVEGRLVGRIFETLWAQFDVRGVQVMFQLELWSLRPSSLERGGDWGLWEVLRLIRMGSGVVLRCRQEWDEVAEC